MEFGTIEKYSEFDYDEEMVMGAIDWENLDETDKNFWQHQIQYHQPDVSGSSCAIEAGNGILSNLFNYEFGLDERKAKRELAIKEYGAVEGTGMRIYRAVDLHRNTWNERFPNNKISTFKTEVGSDVFWQLINKGFMCQTGQYVTGWNKDKFDDGIINDSQPDTATKSGHSIFEVEPNKEWDEKGAELIVVNSYVKTSPKNIYGIEELKKQQADGRMFKYAYFYIPQKLLMKEEQELTVENMLRVAKEKGISTCERLDDPVTRREAIVLATRGYILAKNEG